MSGVEIIETKALVTGDNDVQAQKLRETLKDKGVYFVNVMASPGAGKTSTLTNIINALKDEYKIGVIEADVDSDVDAKTMQALGVKVIQLHTGGACHMDTHMTEEGLINMGYDDLDLVFLENIGNLVCPAEFDIGEDLKLMILSVPEGHDKPLKYPLMFTVSDCLLINKIDVAPIFDFDQDLCKQYVHKLNKDMDIFAVSAKTHAGFDDVVAYLKEKIETKKGEQA